MTMEGQKVAAVMDSDASVSCSVRNFGFAFNDSNFSDRILRIEILDETSLSAVQKDKEDPVELVLNVYSDTEDEEERKRKRPRTEIKKDDLSELELELKVKVKEKENEKEEEEEEEEEKEKEGVGHGDEEALPRSCDEGLRCIKTLHINSIVLAAESPFFYKLFTNGMKESGNRYVSLKINASAEDALMELLRFMYSKTLSATTAPAILDILIIADEYEVDSCVKYCSCLLRNMVTTPESALIFLQLPAHISKIEPVQPLVDVAKKHFVAHYRDISKSKDEVLKLPLVGIKEILSSDDLQVGSEDTVYNFILKWVRKHFQNSEERQEVLEKHLHQLIRFPFMSFQKLQEVLQCSDFGYELASKCVAMALSYKAASPYEQCRLSATNHQLQCVERSYRLRPIKMVGFELPYQQSVVYLELKREECAKLHPAGMIYSQSFPLGQHTFFLVADCNMDQQRQFCRLGLYLGIQGKESVSCSVDCEFAARSNPTKNYVNKKKIITAFTAGKTLGFRDLFNCSWSSFMADESPYFINDVLYIRAELSIKN